MSTILVAPEMARTAEYANQLSSAKACPFCQGGNAFLLEATAGVPYEKGHKLPLSVPEKKLYQGRSVYAHFNSWPTRGSEIIPGLLNPNNHSPRAHHYVVIPRKHVLELEELASDEIDELMGVARDLVDFDLLYCRQGRDFARTGASIAHAHFHAIGIETTKSVEVGFGPWGSVTDEGRAALPRYEAESLGSYQLPFCSFKYAHWYCYELEDRYHPGIEREFVIEFEFPDVYDLEDIGFSGARGLFKMVGEIDRRFNLPAGILWYDKAAARQGRYLQIRYFLPMRNQLVIARAAKPE